MIESLTKERHQNVFDLLMQSAKWRILVFDSSGKSYRGNLLFATKAAAESKIYSVEKGLAEGVLHGVETQDGVITHESYSHSMPMPVLI